ncbi:hypothetical protein SRHO_G00300810 [Serrasalmus rhombeus]
MFMLQYTVSPTLAVPVTELVGHHKYSKLTPVRRPESRLGRKQVDFGVISALNEGVEAVRLSRFQMPQ